MGILDFLFGNRIETTSFNTLRKKLVELRESNIYPYTYNLPQAISLPNDFWENVIPIYRKTYKDDLERAFSIFWADGETIFTEVATGSNTNVKSGGTIQVKYSNHPTQSNYARKEVFLDGKVIKNRDVYIKNVPKTLEVQYLFNIHTHPKHLNESGNTYYNFFSAQDIKSMISSKAIMTGLVTDTLWLLIRTNQTTENVDTLTDSEVTPQYLEEVLNIGVYRAEFNRKAFRYKLLNSN